MTQNQFYKTVHKIQSFCGRFPFVYLYGAGAYGKAALLLFHELRIPIQGCCVTERTETVCSFHGVTVPVYEFGEIPHPMDQCGFVLALKKAYQQEVLDFLGHQGAHIHCFALDNAFWGYYQKYIRYFESLPLSSQQQFLRHPSLLSAGKAMESKGNRPIIISRSAGLGDVLCMEPIVRKLTQLEYQVFVETLWQDLFRYNHSAAGTFSWQNVPPPLDENALEIYCDIAYEMHPLKAMQEAYIDTILPFVPQLQLSEEEKIPIYDRALIHSHSGRNAKKISINNEASGWGCRMFDKEKMRAVALYLQNKGCEIYEIGINENNYLGIGKNCYGLKLHDTALLMSEMDMYVGVDNGLMHLAQSIRLPIFVLFGAVCPNFRIYDWSRARVMWKNVDELPCAACYHRRMIPCREPKCHWDTVRCLDWSVEEVIEAFETEKYDNPPKLLKEIYEPIWWNEMA